MRTLFSLSYLLLATLASALDFIVIDDIRVSDGWQEVAIGCEYQDPVIVTGAITNNDTNSVVAQIRNVTTHSFEVRLIDWGTQALHTGSESITCMIAENGIQEYGGLTILAGKKNDFADTIVMNANGQTGYQNIYFTETPILKQDTSSSLWNYNVFGQVIGDASPDPLHVRNHIAGGWTGRYQFRFEKGARDTVDIPVEEFHYIVAQCGSTDNSVPQRIESFTGARTYEEVLKPLTLPTLDCPPVLMLDAPYIRGGDNTTIRYQDLLDGFVNIRTDEGPEWDGNHTTEEVSALVVGVNHDYVAPIESSILDYLAANYIPLSEQGSFLTTDFAASNYLPINGGGITGSSSTGFAVGNSEASEDFAIAMGSSHAEGEYSIAMGESFAGDDYATAMGQSYAIGDYSTATGNSEAHGNYSTAMGNSEAHGSYSTAMGRSTAGAYGATTLGVYNQIVANFDSTNYIHTWSGDRLNSVLEVGIGTSDTDRKNALTVFQDGSCDIGYNATDGTAPLVVNSDGSVIVKKTLILEQPQGDILMGDFATSEPAE